MSELDQQPRLEELLDLLRRERADFLNFKHRIERERAADRERARGEVVVRLFPLLDELDRALSQLPNELATHPWIKGVLLLRSRLTETLRDLGVERVGVQGEDFDPERHEAILYEGQPNVQDRRVSAVLRAGYRLGERLLRPAEVSVVGPPEPGESTVSVEERDRESRAPRSPARDEPEGG